MNIKSTLILTASVLTLFLFGCQSDPNSPGENGFLADQPVYQTLDGDIALMKAGGMPMDSAAGVFSIGWNEIFRPFMETSNIKGMAFAVAFGEDPTDLLHLRKFGLDMGDLFINYTGNRIEMYKNVHPRRGVAYSLFERPFGHCNSENLLEFMPNTEYQFEVTGSEVFAPAIINVTSPTALMDIISPAFGEVIDPTQDLTINWDGGNEGKVGIRLMPHLRPHRRPGGGHPRRGEEHPPFDRVIFVVLDENTGTYTFPSQQIQRILNGIPTNGLRAEVSQMDFGEVQHENGPLLTAMRNGNSIMLRLQE